MAKANKCRVCGTTSPEKWIGSNRDLCSKCIDTCHNCGGSGEVHILMDTFKCGTCNGRGTVAIDRVPKFRMPDEAPPTAEVPEHLMPSKEQVAMAKRSAVISTPRMALIGLMLATQGIQPMLNHHPVKELKSDD